MKLFVFATELNYVWRMHARIGILYSVCIIENVVINQYPYASNWRSTFGSSKKVLYDHLNQKSVSILEGFHIYVARSMHLALSVNHQNPNWLTSPSHPINVTMTHTIIELFIITVWLNCFRALEKMLICWEYETTQFELRNRRIKKVNCEMWGKSFWSGCGPFKFEY